jgi:uncharacterized protein YabE (DUF348 family)
VPGPLEDWTRVTLPHPAQGSPSDSLINPEVDGDVGITEHFTQHFTEHLTEPIGPPPLAEEVFPAAMFAVSNAEVMASLPPGHPSGPMPVVAAGEADVMTAPLPPPPPPPPEPPKRRRAGLLVSAAAVVLVGSGGAAAYAAAHKTVTLDVDGEVTTVETFEGDVADLLAGEGVEVTGRDAVTPGVDGALREGSTVVVRYGHQVTLRADGERRTAWVTALDADQALATLANQGDDVVLVPSRSGASVTLPMRLDLDGPVRLVVGGEVRQVADGAVPLDELLAANEVRVDGDDRITVERGRPDSPGAATLTVVVQKVQTSIEETVSEVPFETVTAADPNRYEDLGPYLATDGVVGKRVTSWDVTTIDGKVVDKEQLSTWVAKRPVDEVIMYGTKARPEPEPEPKPKPKPKPESKTDPKPEPKPDPEPDSKPEPKPDSKLHVEAPVEETKAQS